MSCAHLFGGEWVRVRHVPAGNVWHPANDELAGTDVYGTECVDSAPWSVNFASKLPAGCTYSEFLFSTGDCTKWLAATTDAVIGETYGSASRPILASSDNASNYSARWYNRGFGSDPWISIIDHHDASAVGKMMYGEYSWHEHTNSIQLGGADVYIRDPDCPSAQAQPCMTPSKSAQPSSEPSLAPSKSAQPSSEPSLTPSKSSEPSSAPSTSSQPSAEPSSQPSSGPSSEPSSIPSTHPSDEPSSGPSAEPSSVPSSEPSSMPSCTPSSAPTPPEMTHLFYPDWSSNERSCLNDGEQPHYMSINTADYMSSTLAACCTKWFTWDVDKCIGSHPDDCTEHLYYPDWQGRSHKCVADGNEPAYMNTNSHIYFFNTLQIVARHFICGITTIVLELPRMMQQTRCTIQIGRMQLTFVKQMGISRSI